jgi:hypothetical protein
LVEIRRWYSAAKLFAGFPDESGEKAEMNLGSGVSTFLRIPGTKRHSKTRRH